MENKKIILAGGTGFIGQEMIRYFGKNNHIIVLTRNLPDAANNRNQYDTLTKEELLQTEFIVWDGKTVGSWVTSLENADIIVNLAGKSVNCRYTPSNKQAILFSRLDAVNALGKAIQQCKQPPKLWINSSSATIYRHANDKPQDEFSGEIKNDFSVQVCKQWEEAFYNQQTSFTRKVALRMAITLGAGGVLIPYFNLLKFKLGGYQGNGKQMYSWVHIEDTCRMIEWIAENEKLEGTFNCSAPNPVSNRVFMQTLRKATNHRFGLPAYKWMLQVGAAIMGTEAELVLKSRWVIPTRIMQTGFTFKYPFLKEALQEIIEKTPRKQYELL
jgi:uncharacterized protein (TIGR01777 family)